MDLVLLWNQLPGDLKGCVGWYLQYKNPPPAPSDSGWDKLKPFPARWSAGMFHSFDTKQCAFHSFTYNPDTMRRYITGYGSRRKDTIWAVRMLCKACLHIVSDNTVWYISELSTELNNIGEGKE